MWTSVSMCVFKWVSVCQRASLKLSLRPPLSGSLSDSRHMNLNTILFTCELSWRALKAAGFADSGLVSLAPSPPMPLHPLPRALVAAVGRTAAGPRPAQLLLGHQRTWQTLWGENSKTTLITNIPQTCDYRLIPATTWRNNEQQACY